MKNPTTASSTSTDVGKPSHCRMKAYLASRSVPWVLAISLVTNLESTTARATLQVLQFRRHLPGLRGTQGEVGDVHAVRVLLLPVVLGGADLTLSPADILKAQAD